MKTTCTLIAALLAASSVACGDSNTPRVENNGATNNGATNNGATNNGATNNGATNNGATNNGATNNGATNNGATNNGATNNGATNNGLPSEVTYHGHIRPLLEANCTQCHYEGGIGPFPLVEYAQVQPLAALIEAVTVSGQMPPWPPSDDCGDFKYERKLEPDEIALIQRWVATGKAEGDPADYVAPQLDTVDLGPADYVLDIGLEYTPSPPGGGTDDYHCFIVEPGFTEDRFVNAFNVRPGDISTVHHVLFWRVDDSNLAGARAKESSPGAGYTCFGSNGLGGDTELGLIGGWVPGTVPVQFGEGQGMRVSSDSFIVVQIHYNTLNGANPDRTEIDFWFTDGPASTPLAMYPLLDNDLFVPAGEQNGQAGRSVVLPISAPIYGVVPHMHQLGTRIKVSAGDQCLVEIPEWDFNWQGFYLFRDPMTASAGTSLKLECWYDNSMDNQPAGQTPQDVQWGEGTRDEMCLNYFITRELPFL